MKHTYKLEESSSEWLRNEAYTISLCTHEVYKLFPRLRRNGLRLTVSTEPFYRSVTCDILYGSWVRVNSTDPQAWIPLTSSTARTIEKDFGVDTGYGTPYSPLTSPIAITLHIRFTNAPRPHIVVT